MRRSLSITAKKLVRAGLSVIPIKADGSKGPAVKWKKYQGEIVDDASLKKWFSSGDPVGIGVVCGTVSGNLEVLDFDDGSLYGLFCRLVGDDTLLASLPTVLTPRQGYHVYYHCPEGIEQNRKLAQRLDEGGKPATTIETRGEGGYVIHPDSPSECHPLNSKYQLVRGDPLDIPKISAEDRQLFFNAAKALSEIPPQKRDYRSADLGEQNRPGDDFNRTASWDEILPPHGWKHLYSQEGIGYWQRPDKQKAVSATTNWAGSDRLYVFSTNADPFEAGVSYKKFDAYALLNFGGDFSAAASDLVARGYGEGAFSAFSANEDSGWPRPLGDAALYGLAGDFVRLVEPQSESDPAALLFQLLAAFGNVIGRGPYFEVENDKHYSNIFVAICGRTAKGRKGTAWSRVKKLFELVS